MHFLIQPNITISSKGLVNLRMCSDARVFRRSRVSEIKSKTSKTWRTLNHAGSSSSSLVHIGTEFVAFYQSFKSKRLVIPAIDMFDMGTRVNFDETT
jgi:hypothetical protein